MNDSGFTYKGVYYRSMTVSDMEILQKANNVCAVGGEATINDMLQILYVTSQPIRNLVKLTRDMELFEEEVMEFGSQFNVSDLGELNRIVSEEINPVFVEPIIDGDSEKKS